MSEFKGTKGKWKIVGSNTDEINSDSGFHVCDVWDMGTANFPTKSEAKANALLISKAPEMLEMLESVLLTWESNGNFDNEYFSNIKQLIKQATDIDCSDSDSITNNIYNR